MHAALRRDLPLEIPKPDAMTLSVSAPCGGSGQPESRAEHNGDGKVFSENGTSRYSRSRLLAFEAGENRLRALMRRMD